MKLSTLAWYYLHLVELMINNYLRRIIKRMLELSRRLWQIFFPAFFTCVLGIIPVLILLEGKWYEGLVLITLGFLALVSLAIGIIALIYDFKETRWKDKAKYIGTIKDPPFFTGY